MDVQTVIAEFHGVLSSSGDRNSATWLETFQKFPGVWRLCTDILKLSEVDFPGTMHSSTVAQIRLYCAQTLRNKIARNDHLSGVGGGLSEEDGQRLLVEITGLCTIQAMRSVQLHTESLSDSPSQNPVSDAILCQLSLALCSLICKSGWDAVRCVGQAVNSLDVPRGQSEISLSVKLVSKVALLSVLPEEATSDKLSPSRLAELKGLRALSSSVLSLIAAARQTGNEFVVVSALRCLCNWIQHDLIPWDPTMMTGVADACARVLQEAAACVLPNPQSAGAGSPKSSVVMTLSEAAADILITLLEPEDSSQQQGHQRQRQDQPPQTGQLRLIKGFAPAVGGVAVKILAPALNSLRPLCVLQQPQQDQQQPQQQQQQRTTVPKALLARQKKQQLLAVHLSNCIVRVCVAVVDCAISDFIPALKNNHSEWSQVWFPLLHVMLAATSHPSPQVAGNVFELWTSLRAAIDANGDSTTLSPNETLTSLLLAACENLRVVSVYPAHYRVMDPQQREDWEEFRNDIRDCIRSIVTPKKKGQGLVGDLTRLVFHNITLRLSTILRENGDGGSNGLPFLKWEEAESCLHILSAIAKGMGDDKQVVDTTKLALMLLARNKHPALWCQGALYIGVYARVVVRDPSLLAPSLFLLLNSLAFSMFDQVFSFRSKQDHCGCVGLVKIAMAARPLSEQPSSTSPAISIDPSFFTTTVGVYHNNPTKDRCMSASSQLLLLEALALLSAHTSHRVFPEFFQGLVNPFVAALNGFHKLHSVTGWKNLTELEIRELQTLLASLSVIMKNVTYRGPERAKMEPSDPPPDNPVAQFLHKHWPLLTSLMQALAFKPVLIQALCEVIESCVSNLEPWFFIQAFTSLVGTLLPVVRGALQHCAPVLRVFSASVLRLPHPPLLPPQPPSSLKQTKGNKNNSTHSDQNTAGVSNQNKKSGSKRQVSWTARELWVGCELLTGLMREVTSIMAPALVSEPSPVQNSGADLFDMAPDIVEEFFKFVIHCGEVAPIILLAPMTLPSSSVSSSRVGPPSSLSGQSSIVLESCILAAISSLRCQEREAGRTVIRFLQAVAIWHGGVAPAGLADSLPPTLRGHDVAGTMSIEISRIMATHGPAVCHAALSGCAGAMPSWMLERLVGLLWTMAYNFSLSTTNYEGTSSFFDWIVQGAKKIAWEGSKEKKSRKQSGHHDPEDLDTCRGQRKAEKLAQDMLQPIKDSDFSGFKKLVKKWSGGKKKGSNQEP